MDTESLSSKVLRTILCIPLIFLSLTVTLFAWNYVISPFFGEVGFHIRLIDYKMAFVLMIILNFLRNRELKEPHDNDSRWFSLLKTYIKRTIDLLVLYVASLFI